MSEEPEEITAVDVWEYVDENAPVNTHSIERGFYDPEFCNECGRETEQSKIRGKFVHDFVGPLVYRLHQAGYLEADKAWRFETVPENGTPPEDL